MKTEVVRVIHGLNILFKSWPGLSFVATEQRIPRGEIVDAIWSTAGSMSHSYNPELPSQPFELVALEAALKAVCASYDIKAKQLGATINPMCDALLKKVPARPGPPSPLLSPPPHVN